MIEEKRMTFYFSHNNYTPSSPKLFCYALGFWGMTFQGKTQVTPKGGMFDRGIL